MAFGSDVKPLRIGTVSYLNAVPLNIGLEGRPGIVLEHDVPSALADRLAAETLDVGLIPVIEVARHPDYRIVPDVAIGCRGPVRSVKLYCRRPLAEVRSVALDPSSRTSAALTRIMMEKVWGVYPTYVPVPRGSSPEQVDADAFLLIGDPALRRGVTEWEEIDLGEAWYAETGLPFVFAVWAVRPNAAGEEVARLLRDAKRVGLERLDAIAATESRRRGIPESECRRYLREEISYDLDDAHVAGLRWFLNLALACQLIEPPVPDLDAAFIRA